MVTRSEGITAGMILLTPGNFEQVRFDNDELGVEVFLSYYREDPTDTFSNLFEWRECAKLFQEYGIEIDEEDFESYSDYEYNYEFFEAMFEAMLNPPTTKPLEDWM